MAVEGKMQYLFDESGRRYLDVSCSHSCCINASLVSRLARTMRDGDSEPLIYSTVEPHEGCSLR